MIMTNKDEVNNYDLALKPQRTIAVDKTKLRENSQVLILKQ